MKVKNEAGFWRRLAGLWIDLFVAWSVTEFFMALLQLVSFRIAFETVFVLTGACYTMVMLWTRGQTAGKMLMRIVVASISGEPVRSRDILLREVFGKWGVTMSLPVMLAMILLGNAWLPTVSSILVMIPVALFCIIYFLYKKRAWYDTMAGLKVIREPGTAIAKRGFYILVAAALLGIGTMGAEYLLLERVPCRVAAFQSYASTKPFVRFLKKQHTTPVDYVMGLFDKYDVVVLCERAHPEMTQWDFIYDVVRDPRFISKVGHIFTEYGQKGMQADLDKFMMTDSLGEPQVKDQVLHLMRNMPVWPSWTNYNLYHYLTRLYHLNQALPAGNRVRHHFTDAAVDWSAIRTNKDYKEYQRKLIWNRDSLMAVTVIEEMRELAAKPGKQPKCLVIMNYRHAMDLTDRLPGAPRVNTYEFLKDSFGNRAANVLINTRFIVSVPLAGGVWDDAFEQTGNRPVGFDFRGSPFGSCNFDLFPFDMIFRPMKGPSANGSLRYRDVFNGFVFTHPVKDQYFQPNTPGYFDGFEQEYIRRAACLGDEFRKAAMAEMQRLKAEKPGEITKHVEFTVETWISLSFYGFAAIGLVIGIIAFLSGKPWLPAREPENNMV